jgi:hypothetical protein
MIIPDSNGLDPAIPLKRAPPCHIYRDRRVKPGDDKYEIALRLSRAR